MLAIRSQTKVALGISFQLIQESEGTLLGKGVRDEMEHMIGLTEPLISKAFN